MCIAVPRDRFLVVGAALVLLVAVFLVAGACSSADADRVETGPGATAVVGSTTPLPSPGTPADGPVGTLLELLVGRWVLVAVDGEPLDGDEREAYSMFVRAADQGLPMQVSTGSPRCPGGWGAGALVERDGRFFFTAGDVLGLQCGLAVQQLPAYMFDDLAHANGVTIDVLDEDTIAVTSPDRTLQFERR